MKEEPNEIRCDNCVQVLDPNAHPALWFPDETVHSFTQQLAIMTRQFCCGVVSHTEPVATVSAYLHPVKENARLLCNLMNQYLLAGRPQPSWLTAAWGGWENKFTRPRHKARREATG